MLKNRALGLGALFSAFRARIALTWGLTLFESLLLALIPLFIGFAIDGLLADSVQAMWPLAGIMTLLTIVAVLRRLYDTRVYGTIRVELGKAQRHQSTSLPVSAMTARLDMGRELVEFLEHTLPDALSSAMQLLIAIAVLYAFSPNLAVSAGIATGALLLIYATFHHRFFRLNGALNQQMEQQVAALEQQSPRFLHLHLLRLRRQEVRLSDSEAILYGLVFLVLLSLILFNLWYAATALDTTVGSIFSIISYSWEFVGAALALPVTLQSWTRLVEITQRLRPASDGPADARTSSHR